jgi:hypothetical protein
MGSPPSEVILPPDFAVLYDVSEILSVVKRGSLFCKSPGSSLLHAKRNKEKMNKNLFIKEFV